MIRRSTACSAFSFFVFSLLCCVWSCKDPQPDGVRGYGKDTTRLNLHLVFRDTSGKAVFDTTYKFQLGARDTFHFTELADCSGPPTKTGGSSPCTVDGEVFEDKDDDDDDVPN